MGVDYLNCKQYEKAYKIFIKVGDAMANFNLALMHLNGDGVPKSAEMGIFYAKKADEWLVNRNGNRFANALYLIGEVYIGRYGKEYKDYEKAFEYVNTAAQHGSAAAQRDNYYLHRYGLGTRKNAKIAAKWLKEAATNGDASAQQTLGLAYMNGWAPEIQKDEFAAFPLLKKSADQGNRTAKLHLANLMLHAESEDLRNAEEALLISLDLMAKAGKEVDWKHHSLLGSAYIALGKIDLGVSSYESAIKISGKDLAKKLQRLLRNKGLYAGAIDGVYGNNTKKGLISYINKDGALRFF